MSHVSKRTKIALGAVVLVGLVASTARLVIAADKYTGPAKVGAIVVAPTGDFMFHLEGLPQLCNSTPTGDGRDWVGVNGAYATSDGKKNLLSIITSAKLAGRPVTVRGLNNATRGEWGCRLEAVTFE